MGLTLSLQRLTQAAQRFAQRPVRMIRQLGGRVVSSAISAIGGAALVFRILSYKGVITPDSPLWYLVDGARILNYPSDGDPSANSAAPGGKKPSRTEAIFAWTAVRLSAVRQWVYTNGATFAGALYAVFNSFPVIQFLLLGSQWGDDMKPPYPLFRTEAYWVSRLMPSKLPDNERSDNAAVRGLPSLLANMLIARIDFLLRFVMSLVYGHYSLRNDEGYRIPVLYSTVGYLGIPDGGDPSGTQSLWSWSQGSREKLLALRDGTAGPAIDEQTIQLMAELSWLAYEEGCVVQDVLDKVLGVGDERLRPADTGSKVPVRRTVTLEFYSVTYKSDGQAVEKGVDTQCLLLRYGKLAVVSFRGTQPVSFFDWAYNFTTSAIHRHAASDPPQPWTPGLPAKDGSRRTMMTMFGGQDGGSAAPASAARPLRVHEGFSEALGLPLQTADGAQCFVSRYTRYYRTDGAPAVGRASGLVDSTGLMTQQICESSAGGPYTVIADALHTLIAEAGSEVPEIYVTGHSLGGALAALFTTAWCSNNPGLIDKMHLVTYGQPRVGDRAYAVSLIGFLGGVAAEPDATRFARVVNLNDVVTRVPTFFTDTGSAFVHADGKNTSWFIGNNGGLEGPAQAIPPMYQLVHYSWRKLKAATASKQKPQPESSLRLLLRAALTPIGVANDHLDYNALLRQLGDNLPDGKDLAALEALLDAVLKRKPLAEQLVFPLAWWKEAPREAHELIDMKLRPEFGNGPPSSDAVYFVSKTWARCLGTRAAGTSNSGASQLTAAGTDSSSSSATMQASPGPSSGGGTSDSAASPVTDVAGAKRRLERQSGDHCRGCDEDNKEQLTLVDRQVPTTDAVRYSCEPTSGSATGLHLRAEQTFRIIRGGPATRVVVEWNMLVCCHRSTDDDESAALGVCLKISDFSGTVSEEGKGRERCYLEQVSMDAVAKYTNGSRSPLKVMLDGRDPTLDELSLLSAEVTEQQLKQHKGWTFRWTLGPQVTIGSLSLQAGSISGELVAPPAEWGRSAETGARILVENCRRDMQAKLILGRSRSATVVTGNWNRRLSLSIGEVLFASDVCRDPETKVLKLVLQPSATFFRFKNPVAARDVLQSTSNDPSYNTQFLAFQVNVTLNPSRLRGTRY